MDNSWVDMIIKEETETLIKEEVKQETETDDEKDEKQKSNDHKRKRQNSNESGCEKKVRRKSLNKIETDSEILQRRQKNIDYGKNTVGYTNYVRQVPIDKRTKDHPRTPDKYYKYSRRSWDKLIKIWRKELHEFDPNIKAGPKVELDSS